MPVRPPIGDVETQVVLPRRQRRRGQLVVVGGDEGRDADSMPSNGGAPNCAKNALHGTCGAIVDSFATGIGW
jgi:hypothetical protein